MAEKTYREISIHAPLTGCDAVKVHYYPIKLGSPSTHPSRGATVVLCEHSERVPHFNPRTPHGVRHANAPIRVASSSFQSTHPSRGATLVPVTTCWSPDDFNPRTPHGVRRRVLVVVTANTAFQSTHPSRGATYFGRYCWC